MIYSVRMGLPNSAPAPPGLPNSAPPNSAPIQVALQRQAPTFTWACYQINNNNNNNNNISCVNH